MSSTVMSLTNMCSTNISSTNTSSTNISPTNISPTKTSSADTLSTNTSSTKISPTSQESDVCPPGNNDVLCGRGGDVQNHAGNRRYRAWVKERQEAYSLCNKRGKQIIYAREVVNLVKSLNPSGRFLEKISSYPSRWIEIVDQRALHKTTQALREGAPATRAEAKLKQVIAQPSRQVIQPFIPLYPCYGSFHQPIIPNPTSLDLIDNRLNEVELMVKRIQTQKRYRAHQKYLYNLYAAQTLRGNQVLSPRDQHVPSKNKSVMTKRDLTEDIVRLTQEYWSIGNSKKRSIIGENIFPTKKARAHSEYLAFSGIFQKQPF